MINAVREKKGTQGLEDILDDIQVSTAGRISDIEIFEQGNRHAGTKAVFRGLDGGRHVVLTVMKKPVNNVAQRAVSAGYGLENEIRIARRFGVDEAIENHLAITYETFTTEGGEVVALSPEIKGDCLSDYVEKDKFDLKGFRSFFRQAVSSQVFMKSKGIYHRDLSPYNLLVKKNGTLEAWTTDFGSACEIEQARVETLATRGARTVRDPRVTKEGSVYSDAQEVYAVAQDMLVALNGKPAVKYDSDEIKRWNPEAHDALVAQAIKKLPRWARKRYGKLIYKAMASGGDYATIEEFQEDFERASKQGLIEKLKKETSAKLAVGGLAGILVLGSLGSLGVYNLNGSHKKDLETAVAEASKYVVETQFNKDLDFVNNLLNLELSILDKDAHEIIYNERIKPRYLQLKQGQNLSVHTYPYEQPRPNDIGIAFPRFKGKVYFEGWKGESFFTECIDGRPNAYYDIGGPNLAWIEMQVPKDMPDGAYTLVTEIYAQDKQDLPNQITALGEIKYKEPGKAISRKRIPVVVGNPENKIYLNNLTFSFSNYASFDNLEQEPFKGDPNLMITKDLPRDLTYEMAIPELGVRGVFGKDGSDCSGSLRLPKPPKDLETRTLQLVVRDKRKGKGSVVAYMFLPIRCRNVGDIYYEWEGAAPGPEFSDKLVEYRKAIYQEK